MRGNLEWRAVESWESWNRRRAICIFNKYPKIRIAAEYSRRKVSGDTLVQEDDGRGDFLETRAQGIGVSPIMRIPEEYPGRKEKRRVTK